MQLIPECQNISRPDSLWALAEPILSHNPLCKMEFKDTVLKSYNLNCIAVSAAPKQYESLFLFAVSEVCCCELVYQCEGVA